MRKKTIFLIILFIALFIQIFSFSNTALGAEQKEILVVGEQIEQALLERISLDESFDITVRENLVDDFSSFEFAANHSK